MIRTTLWMTAVCCLIPLSWFSCPDSSALVFGAGQGGRGGGCASRSGGGGGRPSMGGGQPASGNRAPSFTRSGGNLGAAEAGRSEEANRSFGRNTFNVGNQSINIGHNSYRPAYARHRAYHGYWNGNWGLGAG